MLPHDVRTADFDRWARPRIGWTKTLLPFRHWASAINDCGSRKLRNVLTKCRILGANCRKLRNSFIFLCYDMPMNSSVVSGWMLGFAVGKGARYCRGGPIRFVRVELLECVYRICWGRDRGWGQKLLYLVFGFGFVLWVKFSAGLGRFTRPRCALRLGDQYCAFYDSIRFSLFQAAGGMRSVACGDVRHRVHDDRICR